MEDLNFARTIYVPICDAISGKIRSLDVDESHTDEMCNIPIDTLVLYSTKNYSVDEDFGAFETI